jgi:hypothetical protein
MRKAQGGGRNRIRLPLVAAVVVALVAVGSGISAGAARSPEEPAERLVLRLTDLPRGYFPLDFSEGANLELICEELEPADPGPRLASFVRRFSPEGCLGLYLRAYRVPGAGPSSQVVGTGAMDVGNAAAADEGFALAGALLAKLTEEPLEEVAPSETIGEASRLFHWKRVPGLFRNGHHLGSFLVWRSGNVLAAAFATGNSLAISDEIVTDLARRQQAHVANPTPYANAERDTSEIFLDDPGLKIPVYWLGRVFDPGHGLPPARLESSYPRSENLRGQKLEIAYSHDVYLSSWTRKGWKRFLQTPRGRIFRTWRCTKSTQVDIPGGHATVFAAYRSFETCPNRRPDFFFAFAYFGNTVVSVNFAGCEWCLDEARGPYNSLRGMKAIVRGLTLRPKTVFIANPS